MIYAAGFLVFTALCLVIQAWNSERRMKRLRASPTVPIAEVAALAGGEGSVCDVVGVARPGPEGLLTAPFSGQPCVWWSTDTWERTYGRDEDGDPTQHDQNHHHESSEMPILVEDATGRVSVHPDGAEQDELTKSFSAFEEVTAAIRTYDEFIRSEHLIPEGQKLFVSGRPVMTPIGPKLENPGARRKLVISTRDESALLDKLRKAKKFDLVQALVVVLIAAGIAIAALVG